MNHWCESCARKNLCYAVDDRPKCFVPITNTASGTPYKIEASVVCRDEQTEDEILREQCRAFIGIVEQTERKSE